jgi:hypothetical protein
MSYHSIDFTQTECSGCSNNAIPFKKDFKCPYCGRATDVYYDFVSEVVTAMIYHKNDHGSFFPGGWYSGSFAEHVEGEVFQIFDELERRKIEKNKESISRTLDKFKYDSEEYKQHFIEIVIAINDKYEIESKNGSVKIAKEERQQDIDKPNESLDERGGSMKTSVKRWWRSVWPSS